MMPETPKKMGELTLGTLTAGMTTARTTDGRCYDDNTLLRGVKTVRPIYITQNRTGLITGITYENILCWEQILGLPISF